MGRQSCDGPSTAKCVRRVFHVCRLHKGVASLASHPESGEHAECSATRRRAYITTNVLPTLIRADREPIRVCTRQGMMGNSTILQCSYTLSVLMCRQIQYACGLKRKSVMKSTAHTQSNQSFRSEDRQRHLRTNTSSWRT